MRYRAVTSFASATLLSRILGLVRESVIAFLLGAGKFSDAFYVAFRIPNLLRDIFGENAIQTAFVPVYIETREKKKDLGVFLGTILFIMLIGGLFVLLLGEVFASYLVSIFAYGFKASPEKFSLTVFLTRITFPFLLFVSLAALVAGVLNSFKKFFVPALSPIFFNLGVIFLGILGYFLLAKNPSSYSMILALGVLVGGIGQFLFQIPYLKKIKPDFKLEFNLSHPSLSKFGKLLVPVLLSTTLTRLTLFVNTLIASFLQDGAISFLNYSFRIMHLPIGLFAVGIATVALTDISEVISRGENPLEEMAKAFRLALFLTLPATLFLIIEAPKIISLIYERGSFGPIETINTASALIFYSLAITPVALSRIMLNYFFASGNIKYPIITFTVGAVCHIFFAIILSRLLNFPGLALASSIASVIQTIILIIGVSNFFKLRKRDWEVVIKIISLNITVAVIWILLDHFLFSSWTVIINLLVGVCFYIFMSHRLKLEERRIIKLGKEGHL
jgi:putative peptidoglycan lipid II flippase